MIFKGALNVFIPNIGKLEEEVNNHNLVPRAFPLEFKGKSPGNEVATTRL